MLLTFENNILKIEMKKIKTIEIKNYEHYEIKNLLIEIILEIIHFKYINIQFIFYKIV